MNVPVTSALPVGAEALDAQGVALARQKRFDQAIEQFRAAVEADPGRFESRRHLAQALTDAGQLEEAEAAWLAYLEARPQHAEAHRHLGNLRRRMEKLESALESLKKAAELEPDTPIFHVDLGIALAHAQRRPEAKEAFQRALELDKDQYDALINLGMLLQEMDEGQEALVHLRRAIELKPDDPSGQNNLGVALSEQGQYDEAITCFQSLLEKKPEYYLGWNNYGNALRSAGRLEEAATALRKALDVKPDYSEAYNNLGIIHAQMVQFDQSLRCYDQALLLRPDYPEAHANRGLVHLLLGNFQQGWADYEWRWQGGHGLKRRKYPGKVWDGSPLAGKRILLYYEQGLGDTFQFIRYAKELKARGATVVFECQPIMRQILSRTEGIDEFVIRGEKPPTCDFYAPLLSLPGLCQTNLDNLPRRVPYIFTDPALMWEWKQRMSQMPEIEGFRIGIVWQGNPQHKGDRYRSIPLKSFATIARIPNVKLISLQKNFGAEQIEQMKGEFPLCDLTGVAETGDGWLRTAAIIANLDLVISADTSVAHLAGAMGVPVWVAIATSPDWRWLLEREDTPWYPTMRLFRQGRIGDWDELFGRMAEALSERLEMAGKNWREPTSSVDQQEAQSLIRQADEQIDKADLAQAQSLLERAVRLDPANANAHQDLGVTYAKQGKLREGMACFRRALELAPDSPGIYGNLGLACYHAGLIEQAVSHLRKAIWLGAGSPEVHKNLALALTALPDPAAAEESYWAALRLRPDDAEAHYRLSQVLLMQGKFEQGWLEHEWRWRWRKRQKRFVGGPRWLGQKLKGKRIVILAEDDARDTVQLARYANMMAEQGAQVALECQPELVKVMASCVGTKLIIPAGEPLPSHDFHATLLSLPAAFGTTLQTVPASRPYLGVDSRLSSLWRDRLNELGPAKIGVALRTDSGDVRGSIPPAHLTRFMAIEGVTLLDLQPLKQRSEAYDQMREQAPQRLLAIEELHPMSADVADRWLNIAAVLRNLDLLITADNTVAHVAGAIGVPTWLVLAQSPDPRWLLGRNDTPWYPTLRLFRQRLRGSWEEPFNEMAAILANRARKLREPAGVHGK